MSKPRVFISGPYSSGDVAQNVRAAINAAHQLMDEGFHPYVPHLTHFQHLVHPRPYEDWMELDLAWLEQCNALLRLPGHSPGAERECERADEFDIPQFHSVEALVRYGGWVGWFG